MNSIVVWIDIWIDCNHIGRLLDLVYAPSAGMRSSVGSTTSFFHTSMVVNTGSNDHLHIRKFIHEGLLSSLSKKTECKSFNEQCRIRL